jgi:hypothetical protein
MAYEEGSNERKAHERLPGKQPHGERLPLGEPVDSCGFVTASSDRHVWVHQRVPGPPHTQCSLFFLLVCLCAVQRLVL